MKADWVFWKLECKKYIKVTPFILLESVIFALLLFIFGAYTSRALYGEKSMGVIRIGIVSEEKSSLSEMLVNFVSSMESIEESCQFITMESEQAYDALMDGSIYAAVILPKGMVEGILDGTNPPATVVFGNAYSKVETAVFKELAGAGERLLSTAQAGIYAADALCIHLEQMDRIPEAEEILNASYLRHALKRAEVFDLREVIATGSTDMKGYYTVSLLLVFLSFAGISMGRYVSVRAEDFQRLICARGIGMAHQYLLESFAFAVVFGVLSMVIAIPFLQWYLMGAGYKLPGCSAWLLLLFLFFVMGSFVRMVMELTGNSSGGLGVAFVILLSLMSAAGIFLPAAFLPVWMERLGKYSPYALWMEAVWGILEGSFPKGVAWWLFLIATGAALIGMGVYLLKSLQWNGRQ